MKRKKSPKADLEKKKTLFLQTGFIISLAIVLLAFEWKSFDKGVITTHDRRIAEVPEEIIHIPNHKEPPPPPKPLKTTTDINIVDNEVDVEDKVIIDVNATEEDPTEKWTPLLRDEKQVKEDKIFVVVEDDPQFPGGNTARMRYLANNIKYPRLAREIGLQGTVYVTFVIEKDGSVTNVRVERGIGQGCDDEALRVIRNMPKWEPGKQLEKPVRVQFNMPIKFILQ